MSDSGDMKSESYAKLKYTESKKYMLPVIAHGEQSSVLYFRQPVDEDDDDPPLGGVFTVTNANKVESLRDHAKSCLKLYSDAKGTNFKLVKLWKFKAVFCEIKDDDVVTLLPTDDDYASFE